MDIVQVGDVHGMAQTYANLGSVYYRQGEWDRAIDYYEKALCANMSWTTLLKNLG